MNLEQKIRDFLEQETQFKITDENENLIQSGVLDSFSMIKLLDFLEKDMGVVINMENLSAENFNSLETITRTIKSSYENKTN